MVVLEWLISRVVPHCCDIQMCGALLRFHALQAPPSFPDLHILKMMGKLPQAAVLSAVLPTQQVACTLSDAMQAAIQDRFEAWAPLTEAQFIAYSSRQK